jgi:signal transduction histidine kinase
MTMSWLNFALLGMGFGAGLGVGWCQRHQPTPVPIMPIDPEHQEQSAPTQSPQEALDQAQLAYHLAATMSQFKGGFLARTAHELRSPLNGLIGAHQLILSDLCESPAEEREFIQQAHDSALKMVAMLDDILTVSKVEHGRLAIDRQPVSLALIFAEVEKLTHLLAADRNVRLQVILPEPNVYVLTDERWLRQVLVNLISEAIAQMPAGKISLTLHPDPTQAQIWLETDCPLDFWREPAQLLQTASIELIQTELLKPLLKTPPQQSTGFTLLLTQMLLAALQGQLTVLALPTEGSELTRMQCTIPWGAV